MTDHPIDSDLVDNVNVSKTDLRSFFKGDVRLRVESVAWVQGHNLTGTLGIDIGGVSYNLDATDTTSADDGSSVIVDTEGNRFKRIAKTRELLTEARTYYVRTDGSDSNNGLADTSGGAFLTLQKAWDTACKLDFNSNIVTIQVDDGTYTAGITAGRESPVGIGVADCLIIQGNLTTPANCFLNCSSAGVGVFEFGLGNVSNAMCTIKGFKIENAGASGSGINAWGPSCYIKIDKIEFSTCAVAHIGVHHGAIVTSLDGNLTVSGNSIFHWLIETQGQLYLDSCAYTLTGTPAFTQWACVADMGQVMAAGASYTGGASSGTQKYLVTRNANIMTAVGVLPGGVDGTATAGGQYL